jgi:hypothetical protein
MYSDTSILYSRDSRATEFTLHRGYVSAFKKLQKYLGNVIPKYDNVRRFNYILPFSSREHISCCHHQRSSFQ